jgi:uncharacterized protein
MRKTFTVLGKELTEHDYPGIFKLAQMDNKKIRLIIKKYIALIKRSLDPQLVVLYGSYVNGNSNKFSDVDLAIFLKKRQIKDYLDTEKYLFKLSGQIDSRLEPNLFFIEDISKSDPTSFITEILQTGKVVYQTR